MIARQTEDPYPHIIRMPQRTPLQVQKITQIGSDINSNNDNDNDSDSNSENFSESDSKSRTDNEQNV